MAKIPQFGNLQLNGAKNGIPSNLISTSKGLRQLGDGIGALADLMLQKKKEDDQLQYQKALLDLDAFGNEELNNPETGYKNLQGENALNEAGNYNQRYTDKISEIRESLKGNSFLDRFDLQTQDMHTSHTRQLMVHESQQQSALALKTMQSSVDLANSNAETLYADPMSLMMGFNNLISRVDEFSEQQGMPAELRQAQKDQLKQQYFSSSLNGWIANTELSGGSFNQLGKEMKQSVAFKQLNEINQAKYLLKIDALSKKQGNELKDKLNLNLTNAWAMQQRGIEAPEIPLSEFNAVYGDKGQQVFDAYQDQQIMARNIGAMQNMSTSDVLQYTSESISKNAKPNEAVEQGNIDLNARPVVKNKDGSISTVRTISFNEDGKEILIPTVADNGQILSDDEAVALYHSSGLHFGKFNSVDAANSYAKALHEDQAATYGGGGLTANTQDANFAERLKLQHIQKQAALRVLKAREDDPIAAAYQAGEIKNLDFTSNKTLQDTLTERITQAIRINSDYQTPLTVFSKTENEAISGMFDKLSAPEVNSMLKIFRQSTGDNITAYNAILKQVGISHPSIAFAGGVLNIGKNVKVKDGGWFSDPMYESPEQISSTIILGRQSRKGVDGMKGYQTPSGTNNDPKVYFDDFVGNVFSGSQQAYEEVYQTALDYYAGESVKVGDFSKDLNKDRWNKAMSAATGGVIDFNGSKTLLPYGMDETLFDDLIKSQYYKKVISTGVVKGETNKKSLFHVYDPTYNVKVDKQDLSSMIMPYQLERRQDGQYYIVNGTTYLYEGEGDNVKAIVLDVYEDN